MNPTPHIHHIPKVIHYCWLGGQPLPPVVEEALASWQRFAPDYTIKKWTEQDIDLTNNAFAREALLHKKWAFASDYARIKVLYEEGGIYMDTDFLLLKKIDILPKSGFFIGAETASLVNSAIMGSCPRHPLLAELLDYYQHTRFNLQQPLPIPRVITPLLNKRGFKTIGKQLLHYGDIQIFPPASFYAFPFPPPPNAHYKDYITDDAIGVHLWEGSWLSANNYFNIGDCKKGLEKLKEEKRDSLFNRGYWWIYCQLKNIFRPFYQKFKAE